MLLNCGVWRRFLRVPWTARRSDQPILKEINPEYSLEGLMLKLKLQYFGHLMLKSWLIWKDPDAGKDWGQEEKGITEDEMVGWHHQHNGHVFGWTLGVGDGQGGGTCCGSWGRKESDMTERLNWTGGSVCFDCPQIKSVSGKQARSSKLREILPIWKGPFVVKKINQ